MRKVIVRNLQAVLLLRRGRGKSAHHRQATGSQRPAGRLWQDDDSTRLIFLGSLALGDETAPVGYGDDPKRDMAGVLERIGPFQVAAGNPMAAKHLEA